MSTFSVNNFVVDVNPLVKFWKPVGPINSGCTIALRSHTLILKSTLQVRIYYAQLFPRVWFMFRFHPRLWFVQSYFDCILLGSVKNLMFNRCWHCSCNRGLYVDGQFYRNLLIISWVGWMPYRGTHRFAPEKWFQHLSLALRQTSVNMSSFPGHVSEMSRQPSPQFNTGLYEENPGHAKY